MFERYTEKARRVIFFARFEASQYGSPYIETEHLLLGLLREDHRIVKHLLPDLKSVGHIREQIEARITRGQRFSTAVEVPLSEECKRALKFAAGESANWRHPHVGTEHLLMGLLQIPTSLAATVLNAQGIDMAGVRETFRGVTKASEYSRSELHPAVPNEGEKLAAQKFLICLREGNWSELSAFFATNASSIDVNGKLWSGQKEIVSNLESLLSPFATKNARYHLEKEICRSGELWVGIVLWSSIHLAAGTFPQQIRMTLVFGNDAGEWSIFLLQIVSVAEEQAGKPAAP